MHCDERQSWDKRALYLDSITCASRSGFGPLMLPLVNRTFKGKKNTSLKPLVGQRRTNLRLSSIFTVPQEVKTGMNQNMHSHFYRLFSLFFFTVILFSSFDNSGQTKPSPQWQSNQINIDRTNKIIKGLANEFQNQFEVVSGISALNACVFRRCVLEITC